METIRRLTPGSSIEDALKASPEEQKRWAEDMIARSNQAIQEEIQEEEQLAKQILHIVKGVEINIAIRSLEYITRILKDGETALGT